jgi:hypothetical protein
MGFDLKCSRCSFVWKDESETAQPPEACPVCGSRMAPRQESADIDFGENQAAGITKTGEWLAIASLACIGVLVVVAYPVSGVLVAGVALAGLVLGIAALISSGGAAMRLRGFPKGSPPREAALRALVLSALAFLAWAFSLATWLFLSRLPP